jgi:hypothetical protein
MCYRQGALSQEARNLSRVQDCLQCVCGDIIFCNVCGGVAQKHKSLCVGAKGMDLAMLELDAALSGLPANPPVILTREGTKKVEAYLRERDFNAKVEIRMEGLGCSTSLSSVGREDNALQVCSHCRCLSVHDGMAMY